MTRISFTVTALFLQQPSVPAQWTDIEEFSAVLCIFVCHCDGNCTTLNWSELLQKALKVQCSILYAAFVWFGFIWNIKGTMTCMVRQDILWYDSVWGRRWCFWCGGEAIPAFVYPMLCGGQHAGWDQMKLIGEPNYHLTWGHSFSTLHSLLSQKSSPILQTFLNSLSVELVASVWSPNCSPIFLHHDIFGWCVMPTAFRMFVSLDFVPTLPLKESFEESGIRVGWPAGPLRNPALFSN